MVRWHVFLLSTFSVASAFTVHSMGVQRTCVDVFCASDAFAETQTELTTEMGNMERCSGCQQCTKFGYSVCLRSRTALSRPHRTADGAEGGCGCSHSVPETCRLNRSSSLKSTNDSQKPFTMCYQSTLQLPPTPSALNKKKAAMVTVDPFWLDPYWKGLNLSNLYVHYEYSVATKKYCKGKLLQKEDDDKKYICSSSLRIRMEEDDTTAPTPQEDFDDYPEDYESDEDDDSKDDGTSMVRFDREVFEGAEYVTLWVTVDVFRPRQFNPNDEENPITDLSSVIESKKLEFDLETKIYGTGEDIPDAEDSEEAGEQNASQDGDPQTAADSSSESDDDEDQDRFPDEEMPAGVLKTSSKENVEKTDEEVARDLDFFPASEGDQNREEKDESTASKEDKSFDTATEDDEEKFAEVSQGGESRDTKPDQKESSEADVVEPLPPRPASESEEDSEEEDEDDEEALNEERASDEDENESASRPSQPQTTADSDSQLYNSTLESSTNETSTIFNLFFNVLNFKQYGLAAYVLGITTLLALSALILWCCCRRGTACCAPQTPHTQKNGTANGTMKTYKYTATIQTRPSVDRSEERERLNN